MTHSEQLWFIFPNLIVAHMKLLLQRSFLSQTRSLSLREREKELMYSGPVWAEYGHLCEDWKWSDKFTTDLSQQQYLKGFNLVDGRVGDSRRCWFASAGCLRLQVVVTKEKKPIITKHEVRTSVKQSEL